MTNLITFDDFAQVDIRLGKIVEVEDFPEARNPAYKLKIDFGDEIGIKKSSAQITDHYSKEALRGRLIMGVTNLPPRQIGPFISECLTLGVYDVHKKVRLLGVDESDTESLPLGTKMC